MKYTVRLYENAENDLKRIYEYIAFELCAMNAAKKQYDRVRKAIESLELFPNRNPVYKHTPWYESEVHLLPIDNYIVLYIVDETKKEVVVLRIFYSGASS